MNIDKIKSELSSITRNKKKRSNLIDYLIHNKGMSMTSFVDYLDNLIAEPQSIPIQDLKDIFKVTELDIRLLQDIEQETIQQARIEIEALKEELDDIILKLVELRKKI